MNTLLPKSYLNSMNPNFQMQIPDAMDEYHFTANMYSQIWEDYVECHIEAKIGKPYMDHETGFYEDMIEVIAVHVPDLYLVEFWQMKLQDEMEDIAADWIDEHRDEITSGYED